MPKEYKLISVSEGVLGTLLLGASKLPMEKIENELNSYARDGWEMKFMVLENKRTMLLWERETAIITLERERR